MPVEPEPCRAACGVAVESPVAVSRDCGNDGQSAPMRFKFFTFDEKQQRAVNFYVWDSEEAAERFFSEELRERVTGLYGVAPAIEFVEIAEIVDNSAS